MKTPFFGLVPGTPEIAELFYKLVWLVSESVYQTGHGSPSEDPGISVADRYRLCYQPSADPKMVDVLLRSPTLISLQAD